MINERWQSWGYWGRLYLRLMWPIVAIAVLHHINRDTAVSLGSMIGAAVDALAFPFYIILPILLICNVAPVICWISWQLLLAIERSTGMRVGTRFGERIVTSAYFKTSKPGWPAQWLYCRVLAQTGVAQPLTENLQNDA